MIQCLIYVLIHGNETKGHERLNWRCINIKFIETVFKHCLFN